MSASTTVCVVAEYLLQAVNIKKQTIAQRCIACGYQCQLGTNHKLTTFILKYPPDAPVRMQWCCIEFSQFKITALAFYSLSDKILITAVATSL